MREELFAERIDAFYAQAPGSTVMNGTLALVAAGVMWPSTPGGVLGTWLAGVAASLALRIGLYRGWRGDPRRRENARRWATGCTVAMLSSGLVWGLGGAAMFHPERPLLEAFWMILLCGIAAGVVAANAFHLPALVAYIVPLILPVAIRAAMEGTAEQWAIAAGMALYLVFMLQQGRHQSRLIGDSIAQRLQNVELVARLREEREAAVSAGEAKARFFAAASHDLRQPLHALALFSGALAEEATGPAKDKAHRILQGVDALATLFDHILDSARMETGALRPEVRAFPVQELLDALAAEHAEVARAKGLRLRARPSDAWVSSDPTLARRALGNLVANAVRYTDAGAILVAARRRGAQVVLEVRDSGRGIAPEHHARVFEDFFQVDNPGRDRAKGSGLGLATVKRIAAALDAPLALRSAPGRGSTFSLGLAAAAPEPGSAAAPAPGVSADPLHGHVVLVVDDDRMARDALAGMLERWGIDVLACDSPGAIAGLAEQPAPHALVADWRLGAATGAEAIRAARARWGEALPALIVTGEQDASHAAALAPVLRKPARPVQLRSALQHLLQPAAAARENMPA